MENLNLALKLIGYINLLDEKKADRGFKISAFFLLSQN